LSCWSRWLGARPSSSLSPELSSAHDAKQGHSHRFLRTRPSRAHDRMCQGWPSHRVVTSKTPFTQSIAKSDTVSTRWRLTRWRRGLFGLFRVGFGVSTLEIAQRLGADVVVHPAGHLTLRGVDGHRRTRAPPAASHLAHSSLCWAALGPVTVSSPAPIRPG
jgi:hypothetical protein